MADKDERSLKEIVKRCGFGGKESVQPGVPRAFRRAAPGVPRARPPAGPRLA
jgi:hypothetical protein